MLFYFYTRKIILPGFGSYEKEIVKLLYYYVIPLDFTKAVCWQILITAVSLAFFLLYLERVERSAD